MQKTFLVDKLMNIIKPIMFFINMTPTILSFRLNITNEVITISVHLHTVKQVVIQNTERDIKVLSNVHISNQRRLIRIAHLKTKRHFNIIDYIIKCIFLK